MSALLFLPLPAVEGWTARGSVDVAGGVLTVSAGASAGRRFALEPAVRFLAVAGGGSDPQNLVGKVKREGELKGMGAELVGDSVLLGDVAYEVQPGFAASEERAPVHSPREKAREDAAALARFLLEKLP